MAGKDTKQFVWFNSYTNAVLSVPDEQLRDRLIGAIVMYAAVGTEPDFGEHWALAGIFEAVRPNVENSRAAYENSVKPPKDGKRRRGRPKKETPVVVNDIDAFADTTDIPDEVLEAMAETAEMEAEIW